MKNTKHSWYSSGTHSSHTNWQLFGLVKHIFLLNGAWVILVVKYFKCKPYIISNRLYGKCQEVPELPSNQFLDHSDAIDLKVRAPDPDMNRLLIFQTIFHKYQQSDLGFHYLFLLLISSKGYMQLEMASMHSQSLFNQILAIFPVLSLIHLPWFSKLLWDLSPWHSALSLSIKPWTSLMWLFYSSLFLK